MKLSKKDSTLQIQPIIREYFGDRLQAISEYDFLGSNAIADNHENIVIDLDILTAKSRERAQRYMRVVDVLQDEYNQFYAFLSQALNIGDLPPRAFINESNFCREGNALIDESLTLQNEKVNVLPYLEQIKTTVELELDRIYRDMDRLLTTALFYYFEKFVDNPSTPQPHEIQAYKRVYDQIWDAVTHEEQINRQLFTSSKPEVYDFLESFVNFDQ